MIFLCLEWVFSLVGFCVSTNFDIVLMGLVVNETGPPDVCSPGICSWGYLFIGYFSSLGRFRYHILSAQSSTLLFLRAFYSNLSFWSNLILTLNRVLFHRSARCLVTYDSIQLDVWLVLTLAEFCCNHLLGILVYSNSEECLFSLIY